MSKTLLIVHHTPSPHTHEMFEAVVSGATDPEIEGVEVLRRPALTVSPAEMLAADGYLLGTPANLGYISGALKQYLAEEPLSNKSATDRILSVLAEVVIAPKSRREKRLPPLGDPAVLIHALGCVSAVSRVAVRPTLEKRGDDGEVLLSVLAC